MALASSVRSLIPLIIGLAVGGVGTFMFLDSMPGVKGSVEERANNLELELKKAQNRIAALEADELPAGQRSGAKGRDPHGRVRPGHTFADTARSIAEDLREGRAVSPEDIFRASQPLMRDLAPLFDRMRVKQQRQIIDTMTGELSRKYRLTLPQQTALKQWFEQKSEQEAKRWTEMLGRDGTRLEEVMRASREVRPDEGLDGFMESVLSGEKLASFKAERLTERAQRVQQQADLKVQRLDSIVGLDEAQRDRVFGIMARGSREYDPAMVLEGARGAIPATPSGDPQEAMLGVLRAEQRAAYEAERQRRREEAAKDMEAMGLSLPPTWDPLTQGDFE